MGKTCTQRHNGEIIGYTINNDDSILFDELLKITGNGEDALILYNQTRTEEFQLRKHHYKLDKNDEPIIQNKHANSNRIEDYFIEPKAPVNFQHKPVITSEIDKLAEFYQINTSGYFNAQVDYLKLKSEALKLGYGLKQAESKSYYLTKNGKKYLPEFLKNQTQTKLPGISLKSASKSLWTKYAALITSELPLMTQHEFELYPKSVQQKIVDCL